MSKYGNQGAMVDGIRFDSKKEARRYCELKLLERAGEISGLELQKKFELIPAQYAESTESPKTSPLASGTAKDNQLPQPKKKTRSRQSTKCCVERACNYLADFCYTDRNGRMVVEDTKGMRTEGYIIKRKLMLYVHGIRVVEI